MSSHNDDFFSDEAYMTRLRESHALVERWFSSENQAAQAISWPQKNLNRVLAISGNDLSPNDKRNIDALYLAMKQVAKFKGREEGYFQLEPMPDTARKQKSRSPSPVENTVAGNNSAGLPSDTMLIFKSRGEVRGFVQMILRVTWTRPYEADADAIIENLEPATKTKLEPQAG